MLTRSPSISENGLQQGRRGDALGVRGGVQGRPGDNDEHHQPGHRLLTRSASHLPTLDLNGPAPHTHIIPTRVHTHNGSERRASRRPKVVRGECAERDVDMTDEE